jgi:hypothetical protein
VRWTAGTNFGPQPGSPESALIRDQLRTLLSSPPFVHADRLSQFLSFVVEAALLGETDQQQLKESLIGIEIYGREPGYDSKIEPIVRTEARRRCRIA